MEETLVEDGGEVFQRIGEHGGSQTHICPSGRLPALGEVNGIADLGRQRGVVLRVEQVAKSGMTSAAPSSETNHSIHLCRGDCPAERRATRAGMAGPAA
ncbi:hypothetical protein [Microbispora sp. H13382]|uniref:hypothetical protein n=1 Tax=Microbispora sp. H13382 TaxID=2729112 RepID=UPI0016040541|nr:hypothetical protein [Microbispora sp. H13382]